MTDANQPDLTAEKAREHEAAAGGIQARAVVLEIDEADDAMPDTVDGGDADDDGEVEDPDSGTLDPGV
jgi:hypothetical protein